MGWTAVKVWAVGYVVTASDMNTYLSDNTDYLKGNAGAISLADAIILTAGTAPAGTNVYLVNDNTGDLTLNALTGKTINLAIAGTDYASLDASKLSITGDLNNWDIYQKQMPPPTAPSVAVNAAAGNLNGNYYYRITYVNPQGETEVGAVSAMVSPANEQVDLSSIPVSGDSSVTARKIYRITAGDNPVYGNYKLVTTISDNVTTTYTDNIADGSLGANAPWENTTYGSSVYIYNGTNTRVMHNSSASTSMGWNSLANNRGVGNVGIGPVALYANTIGFFNTAVGFDSQLSNQSNPYCTSVGAYSLYSMTAASGIPDNTAVGCYSAYSLTTAGKATVGGVCAGYTNQTGDDMTAWGWWSQYLCTVGGNTSIGSKSLLYTTTSPNNFAGGLEAGCIAASGNGCNVYLGAKAGGYNGSGTPDYCFYGGYQAGYKNSATRSVGIGLNVHVNATAASTCVSIGADSSYSVTTAGQMTVVGDSAAHAITDQGGGVYLGHYAGYYETAAHKLFIDDRPRTNEADGRAKALVYGIFADTTANQYLYLNGNVLISDTLDVTGNITVSGTVDGVDVAAAKTLLDAHGAAQHNDITRTVFVSAASGYTDGTVAYSNATPFVTLADSAVKEIVLSLQIPVDYSSFGSVKMVWYAAPASGNIYWNFLYSYNADGETFALSSGSSGYGATSTGGVSITNVQESATPLSLSGLAAGDFLGLRVVRDATHANDTINNDIYVLGFLFTYTANQ